MLWENDIEYIISHLLPYFIDSTMRSRQSEGTCQGHRADE